MLNFFAGPGKVPTYVTDRIRDEIKNFQNSGLSILEISHRHSLILELIERVEFKLRSLLAIPDDSAVLLLQGGATLQFHMIPLNCSCSGDWVEYVDTGYWSKKAIQSAQELNRNVKVINTDYLSIPSKLSVDERSKFLHLCSNNTVEGTQWHSWPEVNLPLMVDMSSDLLSRSYDLSGIDICYAHAQKILGAAGVTVVLVSKKILENIPCGVTAFFDYRTHWHAKSNYHTPPVFAIYTIDLMLDWLMNEVGGLSNIEKINNKKAETLYRCIDESDLYKNDISCSSRSLMNVIFDIQDPLVAEQFTGHVKKYDVFGIGGHRSRGGFRVSLYNPVSQDDVEELVDVMRDFEKYRS